MYMYGLAFFQLTYRHLNKQASQAVEVRWSNTHEEALVQEDMTVPIGPFYHLCASKASLRYPTVAIFSLFPGGPQFDQCKRGYFQSADHHEPRLVGAESPEPSGCL